MNNFTARIAGLATLALAALPAAAISTSVHAAPAVHVQVADLNLASAVGVQTLQHRVDHAGNQFCRAETDLTQHAACKAGVRAEVGAKLPGALTFASR